MGADCADNNLHFEHNKCFCIEQRARKGKDSGCPNWNTGIFIIDVQEFEKSKDDLRLKLKNELQQ